MRSYSFITQQQQTNILQFSLLPRLGRLENRLFWGKALKTPGEASTALRQIVKLCKLFGKVKPVLHFSPYFFRFTQNYGQVNGIIRIQREYFRN
jgi:hypothetical protein